MPIRLNGPGRIRKCADGLQNTLDEFRALLMARDTSSDFGEPNNRHDCAPRDRDRRLHMYVYHAARVWCGVGDREEEPVIVYVIIRI